jgi:flagellin-like protein
MKNFRKLRRNVKAVSPVISVLLMIAVAVAASLVAYAWVMGYMNFTTNKVGKAVTIQSVSALGDIYVQNVGDQIVKVSAIYVDGVQKAVAGLPYELDPGETASLTIPGSPNYNGQTRTFKATTEDGAFAEVTKTFPIVP